MKNLVNNCGLGKKKKKKEKENAEIVNVDAQTRNPNTVIYSENEPLSAIISYFIL